MLTIAQKKKITLVYQIGGQGGKAIAPLFYVKANSERLREVMMNLIDNAIKFTNEGGVKVTLEGNDKEVTVAISDTGLGIAQEDIPHLFQKFYRIDSSDTRTIGGTGLGLYLCRRVIELFNGRIWVESKPGQGSVFKFSLPRLSQDEATRMLEAAATAAANAPAEPDDDDNKQSKPEDKPAAAPKEPPLAPSADPSAVKPIAEPAPEPDPEPEPAVTAQPEAEPETESAAEPENEPQTGPATEPEAEANSDNEAEAEPAPPPTVAPVWATAADDTSSASSSDSANPETANPPANRPAAAAVPRLRKAPKSVHLRVQ
jgi:hypothetical protein